MSDSPKPSAFYQYLGAHSLLIGLLPFYLPVYLWGLGFDLQAIALLIAFSGLSFCLCLPLWQFIARQHSLATLLGSTFFLEFVLVASVVLFTQETVLLNKPLLCAAVLGVANGLYNAFFWTTQRTLFLKLLGNNDSGRQFGNFQIFVTLFLKVGILLGGLLLDHGGLLWILALSAALDLGLWVWFRQTLGDTHLSAVDSCGFREAFEFRDSNGSALTFRIDGVFLFLESHFWTLTLFLLVREDYSTLGVVVVVLAAVFGLLFFLIKNSIDHYPGQQVFLVAVVLYSLSWVLRYFIDAQDLTNGTQQWLLIQLILITFCSSFFRLAFNKRFFDHAKSSRGVHYLLAKSVVSQAYLAAFFFLLALIIGFFSLDSLMAINGSYLLAGVVSLIFVAYRPLINQSNTPPN